MLCSFGVLSAIRLVLPKYDICAHIHVKNATNRIVNYDTPGAIIRENMVTTKNSNLAQPSKKSA